MTIRLRREGAGENDADTAWQNGREPELEEGPEHEVPDEGTDRTNKLPSSRT